MVKRTTVEIDEDLLARAKRLLSVRTTGETIEESLRSDFETRERVVAQQESEQSARAQKQVAYLEQFTDLVDTDVLGSNIMWR